MNNLANFNQNAPNQQNQTSSSQNQHNNNNRPGIQPNPGLQHNYLQNNYLQQHNPTQVPRPQNSNLHNPHPPPPPFQHQQQHPPPSQTAPQMQAVFRPSFNPQIGSTTNPNPAQPPPQNSVTSQLNQSIYNPAAACWVCCADGFILLAFGNN